MSSKKIPNIVVEPPGNRSREWLRRDEKVLSPYNRPFYYPLVVEGGEGTIVRGVDGNEYIDFMHACKCARAYFTFKKESSVSVRKTHACFLS